MGKQTSQGTRWESRTVADLEDAFDSRQVPSVVRRRAKAGQKHEADVEAIVGGSTDAVAVLAWHRIVKNPDKTVRVADGVRKVAVVEWDDFCRLLAAAADDHGAFQGKVYVQNKAAQQINVTRILGGLKDWMRNRG